MSTVDSAATTVTATAGRTAQSRPVNCPGHCFISTWIAGKFVLKCINCEETR